MGKALIGLVVVAVIITAIVGLFTDGDSDDAPASSSSGNSESSKSTPESRSTPEPRRTPEPTPKPLTTRDRIEACLSPWDGNHNGFEDRVRPGLNDEGSMETHETRFQTQDADGDGYVQIVMTYSAKNAYGARIKTQAVGRLNYRTCDVIVIDPGY